MKTRRRRSSPFLPIARRSTMAMMSLNHARCVLMAVLLAMAALHSALGSMAAATRSARDRSIPGAAYTPQGAQAAPDGFAP